MPGGFVWRGRSFVVASCSPAKTGIHHLQLPTDLPHECWCRVQQLPDIHRDPIDRLLVDHALTSDMHIVTADANIRRYPVFCI